MQLADSNPLHQHRSSNFDWFNFYIGLFTPTAILTFDRWTSFLSFGWMRMSILRYHTLLLVTPMPHSVVIQYCCLLICSFILWSIWLYSQSSMASLDLSSLAQSASFVILQPKYTKEFTCSNLFSPNSILSTFSQGQKAGSVSVPYWRVGPNIN